MQIVFIQMDELNAIRLGILAFKDDDEPGDDTDGALNRNKTSLEPPTTSENAKVYLQVGNRIRAELGRFAVEVDDDWFSSDKDLLMLEFDREAVLASDISLEEQARLDIESEAKFEVTKPDPPPDPQEKGNKKRKSSSQKAPTTKKPRKEKK